MTPGTVICVDYNFMQLKKVLWRVILFYFRFFYFSGTFKHCLGHRDRHAISGTIPVNPGRITCMLKCINTVNPLFTNIQCNNKLVIMQTCQPLDIAFREICLQNPGDWMKIREISINPVSAYDTSFS